AACAGGERPLGCRIEVGILGDDRKLTGAQIVRQRRRGCNHGMLLAMKSKNEELRMTNGRSPRTCRAVPPWPPAEHRPTPIFTYQHAAQPYGAATILPPYLSAVAGAPRTPRGHAAVDPVSPPVRPAGRRA